MSDSEITHRVGDLSTKLIESIEAQSTMEREIRNLRFRLKESKTAQDRMSDLETKYEAISKENEKNKVELKKQISLKNTAEREVALLRTEVEDLSSSLFDEANNMVSTARKETNDFRLKNERLSSTLYEKDNMIESLIKEKSLLKGIMQDIEEDQKRSRRASQHSSVAGTPKLSQNTFIPNSPLEDCNGLSLRLDVIGFLNFKKFVSHLVKERLFDHAVLKEQSFFKNLLFEDVEPTLRLDLAPDLSYFSRKTLMATLIEGKAVIEPVSGVNEVWFHKKKFSEKLFAYPPGTQPVARRESCSLCGECRDKFLQHARLYVLKIKKPLGGATVEYPLCNHCLCKVRRTCDMFALIRNIANNHKIRIWDFDDDSSYQRIWTELTRHREKMFWARIGVWEQPSGEENESTTDLYDSFGEVEAEASQRVGESQGDKSDERMAFAEAVEINDTENPPTDATESEKQTRVYGQSATINEVEVTEEVDQGDKGGSISSEPLDEYFKQTNEGQGEENGMGDNNKDGDQEVTEGKENEELTEENEKKELDEGKVYEELDEEKEKKSLMKKKEQMRKRVKRKENIQLPATKKVEK